MLPAMVTTADAGVVTVVPPAEGASDTVTAAGRIVPTGKPEPVRVIGEIPACPDVGDAAGERVTAICALSKSGRRSKKGTNAANRPGRQVVAVLAIVF